VIAPPQAEVPAPPPAPEPPKWPVNDHPAPATVVWDSQGLRIDATNSSLQQILNDVASDTGVKIEGFGEDARVFGIYGPGTARDVLSQLFQGTGYNVMIIGDSGQGTPRQILLSLRQAGNAQQPVNMNQSSSGDDNEVEEQQEEPQQPPPVARPQMAPGGPPRTPQQIMQEMQQRQQQMQQRANPQN
jgi:hypothetical protein